MPGNEQLVELVQARYWEGKTADSKAHNAALRALRHPAVSRRLLALARA